MKQERASRPKNSDLPDECHHNNAWCAKVIPTLFEWAGTQPQPFALSDQSIRDALLAITQAIYGDLDLDLEGDNYHDRTKTVYAFTKTVAYSLVSFWILFDL